MLAHQDRTRKCASICTIFAPVANLNRAGRIKKRKALVVCNRQIVPYTDSYGHLKIGTNYSTHPNHGFRLKFGVEDAYGMENFLCGTTLLL